MDNEEFTPDIYTLEDDEGNQMEFELIDSMEYNGKNYYAMIPYHQQSEDMLDDDGELVVLRGETIDGEEMMATIDDDEEYNEIGGIFLERISEMYEDEE